MSVNCVALNSGVTDHHFSESCLSEVTVSIKTFTGEKKITKKGIFNICPYFVLFLCLSFAPFPLNVSRH